MEDYLSKLNQQQRDAVVYCDGPQLVIAGAGSGKTRVLTYKIVHLLAHGYDPWRIMALTFTNKAAREMRERIQTLVGEKTASRLWMGTFHSIFLRILHRHADRIGYKPNFTIYDTGDSKSLVKTIIKDLDLDDKYYKPSGVLSEISWAKNALISPDDYASDPELQEANRRARRPELANVYRIYRERCIAASAMDFDDILYFTNLLLRDNPDLLRHYQEFFSYVLVDEYQDTNFAQHAIITLLTQESGRLCVVGDDAQSIYSFRGANIQNILNMGKHYRGLQTFKLEQNYRSTQNIIDAANSLIDKNVEQIRKRVFSQNERGSRIELAQSYSDFEEAYLVANRISQVKHTTGDSYDEFAILYRTNAQSRILEEALRKRDIPYRIYGGLSFYQRKEIRDAIAYMRLSLNPDDDEALRRIINIPDADSGAKSRGIGETTVAKLTRAAIDRNVSLWQVICDLDTDNPGLNAGTVKKIKGFQRLIERFIELNEAGASADRVATEIIDSTGMISQLVNDRTPESISRRENLEELLSGVKQFVDSRMEEGSEEVRLVDFLSEVSLATDQDQEEDNRAKVTLMTVHAAKGLEFANVFIVGVEEDLFPSAMCREPHEIEEERRLLYVAITRAKRFCMISYARSRYRNGETCSCTPSRFLMDIDLSFLKPVAGTKAPSSAGYRSEALNPSGSRSQFRGGRQTSAPLRTIGATPAQPSNAAKHQTGADDGYKNFAAGQLSEGMRIAHKSFGQGTIVRFTENAQLGTGIVVDFDNTGEKTLLLKYAKIKVN